MKYLKTHLVRADVEDEWIGFDLDGTLAMYTEWKGLSHIGEPIMPMVNLAKKLLAEGKKIRIFTARVAKESTREKATKFINIWCRKYIGQIVPITCEKDLGMIMIYDDKCKQVIPNTGEIIT